MLTIAAVIMWIDSITAFVNPHLYLCSMNTILMNAWLVFYWIASIIWLNGLVQYRIKTWNLVYKTQSTFQLDLPPKTIKHIPVWLCIHSPLDANTRWKYLLLYINYLYLFPSSYFYFILILSTFKKDYEFFQIFVWIAS